MTASTNRIVLNISKSIDENASIYFEKSKKAKRKLEGALEALAASRKKLEKALKEEEKVQKQKQETVAVKQKTKKWYEKFRWFFSSEGFLVVLGRDATTNEIVIKKHTESNDTVLHTDMAGSPFAVIKAENKTPGKATLEEAAQATASFSKAWKLGLSTLDVFYVKPEQVTKTANSGEFMGKGAFMIIGKTNYLHHPAIGLAVGITKDNEIMCAPLSAVKKHCEKFVEIEQGDDKPGDIAKKIKAKIGGELDEIIRAMPSGGIRIK